MTPPLMLALLTQARAINVSAEHIHVEFHETGRAACFWLDVHQDNLATERSPEERMETLIVSALQPVIQALEATGDINAKLIWSNTGYLINWYLTEMKPLLGEACWQRYASAVFLKSSYPTVRITRCGGPS